MTVAACVRTSVHESLHKMVQPPRTNLWTALCQPGLVSALPASCCLADAPAAYIHEHYCATRRSKAMSTAASALQQTMQLKRTLTALAGIRGKSSRSKVLGWQEQPSLVKPGTLATLCETHTGSQLACTQLNEDLCSRLLKGLKGCSKNAHEAMQQGMGVWACLWRHQSTSGCGSWGRSWCLSAALRCSCGGHQLCGLAAAPSGRSGAPLPA